MPNINKNIIMQAGAAVANATNKAAGLLASTPEPGAIISAIQLVNGGRKIGPAALAHFTESVRNKLLSLLVNMEPIQDLHGYDSPWPAGGGKNKVNSDTFYIVNPPSGITLSKSGNTITVNGSVSSDKIFAFCDLTLPVGNYYFSSDRNGVTVRLLKGYSYSLGGDGTFAVDDATQTYRLALYFPAGTTYTNATITNIQIETGSSKTTYAPYSNICPISGRTGLSVYVGPTSAIGDATTYSMDWTTPAGTVYAGSADIVTGDIKAAPYYASYNGETLVGPWVSSMDAFDPEGTPTTGAQVVDLGGAMTEYHITGQDIITLVGDNYIWSDSGDVTITE